VRRRSANHFGAAALGAWSEVSFRGRWHLFHSAPLPQHLFHRVPRSLAPLLRARPLRFVPPDALVEVTLRTVHGRLVLHPGRPGRRLNNLVVGVLGRAERKYAMRIDALAVLSNHAHLLVSPDSPQHPHATAERTQRLSDPPVV
jgi:hypothetical protein